MKEEQVTKALLKWLMDNGWNIICFDFPQSGTGRILHPNGNTDEKNKDAIIPDIVAVKDGECIFAENKDRFYYPDYVKQNELITGNDFSDAISSLLQGFSVSRISYGIGLPLSKHGKSSIEAMHLVDFILCVGEDKTVSIQFNPKAISFI